MIFPAQQMRILVATQPCDFRKGHDGLTSLVQSVLREDPFTGTVFVFRAKRADRLKILFWDGSGHDLQASERNKLRLADDPGWGNAVEPGPV